MGLHVAQAYDEELAGAVVLAALREALRERGRAVLLVPSQVQALRAQRTLARAGVSLGVSVTTPEAWAAQRWEVWGGGSRVVGADAAALVMQGVLAAHAPSGGPLANPGTVRLLCSLARKALPWLAHDGEPDAARLGATAGVSMDVAANTQGALSLTGAEMEALGLVRAYGEALHERGLIEESEMMAALPAALASVAVEPVVCAGFCALERARCELVVGLAALAHVTFVLPVVPDVVRAELRRMVVRLEALCRERGVQASVVAGEPAGETPPAERGVAACGASGCAAPVGCGQAQVPATTVRNAELQRLLGVLYQAGHDNAAEAGGAVRLLEPAGPLAEAELVAREVAAAAESGAREVVVAAPNAPRMWRELAPKLAARGIGVEAQLSVPFAQTEAGRAFLGYVRTVAQLAGLAATWPEPAGPVRRLGSMAWWPPRSLTDFLLSGISHVGRERANRLDAAWRSDRLLSPDDVLTSLLSAKATSQPVEQATRELLKGRIGSAASKLLAPLVTGGAAAGVSGAGETARPDQPATMPQQPIPNAVRAFSTAEATAALGAVLGVASTLKELGVVANPKDAHAVPLAELVSQVELALGEVPVVLRPALEVSGAACVAHILSPNQAILRGPASCDVLVACGLTSDEWPLGTRASLLDELLVSLGIEEAADRVQEERARFWQLVAAPQRVLVLEHTLFTAESRERYPSALLEEVLACYGDCGPARQGLGEGEPAANMSPTGMAPAPVGEEVVFPNGSMDAAARELVIVPPEGVPTMPGGLPLLSASQIESYLECPLKWFSLRRLRLQDADAGCGPLEMGTFVHRVLEVTHRTLLAEGLGRLMGDAVGTVGGATAADGDDLIPSAADAACPQVGRGATEVRGRVAVLASLAGVPLAGEVCAPPAGADEVAAALIMRVPGQRATDGPSLEHATAVLEATFDEHLVHQYQKEGGHAHYQALIAHDTRERSEVARLRRDLVSTLAFEGERLAGFEPRLFEWSFGARRAPVSYAGAYLVGTVDRVDVNAHGQALIIDYKHKGRPGFMAEYGAFGRDGYDPRRPFELPRRVQALIYGQVVRRAFPGLHVAGALYLGTRGAHEMAGAVSANQAHNVLGQPPSPQVAVPDDASLGTHAGTHGMEALMDATEEAIARRIDEMRAGNVEARPLDARACRFCPVMGCERRLR